MPIPKARLDAWIEDVQNDRLDPAALARWAAVEDMPDGLSGLVQALALAIRRADTRTHKAGEGQEARDRRIAALELQLGELAPKKAKRTRVEASLIERLKKSIRDLTGELDKLRAAKPGVVDRDELLRLLGLTDGEWNTKRMRLSLLSPQSFLRWLMARR